MMGRRVLGLLACALLACGPAPRGQRPGAVTSPDAGPDAGDGGPTDTGDGGEDVGPPPPPERFELPPLQTELETYELTMSSSQLERFLSDPYTPEKPATFTAGGTTLKALVRLRGASARHFPKKSWNVDFETARFRGREELNLVAEYQDATQMVEKLAYDLLDAMRVRAPRGRYVRLVVNGEFQGVYLDLEEVDKHFLRAHSFADDDASIYRCGWKDCEMKTWQVPYQGEWKKKTNVEEGTADLDEVLHAINHTPEPRLAGELARRLELDRFLRVLAVDALVSNDYVEDSESFFVHDRVTGRWSYVPWDLNNADARYWHAYPRNATPITSHPMIGFSLADPWVAKMYEKRRDVYSGYLPVFSNLNTRVAFNPALRERLLALVEKALEEVFTPELLHARIDATYALIAPHAADDPYIDQRKFADGPRYLKAYVTKRANFLENELERLRAWKLALVIEELDVQAGTVTLRNRGDASASLGGLVLTADLRRATSANLPSRTLDPGEAVTFDASDLGLRLKPDGELGLFDGQSVAGAIDVLFYGALEPGRRYARAEESGRWEIR